MFQKFSFLVLVLTRLICVTEKKIAIHNMLKKFLKVHKLNPFPRPKPTSAEGKDSFSAVLKIVHAGGNVECYYMAIPAARIMEKYLKFFLARPEVFRRPWDLVVRPDEILTPGQKFFVVPRRTVRKLQKRIRKPKICVNSFMSYSDNSSEIMSLQKDGFLSDSSITSSCFSASRKKFSGKTKKHYVSMALMSSKRLVPLVERRKVRQGTLPFLGRARILSRRLTGKRGGFGMLCHGSHHLQLSARVWGVRNDGDVLSFDI